MRIQRFIALALSKLRYLGSLESALRKARLYNLSKRLYNIVYSSIILKSGKYPLDIRSESADFHVQNRAELDRLRSMTERDTLDSLLSELREDDVFYDIGANVGIYSCLVADRLPDNRVYAFEPHPANAAQLEKNANLNNNDITIIQKALSDRKGKVTLSISIESNTSAPGHNLIELTDSVENYGEGSNEKTTVDMIQGDDLVSTKEIPAPTVLKIDVEGAEYNVLKGFEETLLRDNCRLVLCEVHQNHIPKFGASESDIHKFLQSCGFETSIINEQDEKFHLRAIKDN